MSRINKKHKNQQHKASHQKLNLEEAVMNKITSEQVRMKPRWFFVAGSLFMTAGLTSLTLCVIFLVNLTVFLIRKQGPGYGKLEMMLNTFPWWAPVLAVLGVALGILLLKKYDFSYKKNFLLIIIGFIASIILAALAINYLGLNEFWSRSKPMRKFYQQFENRKYDSSTEQRGLHYKYKSSGQLEKIRH